MAPHIISVTAAPRPALTNTHLPIRVDVGNAGAFCFIYCNKKCNRGINAHEDISSQVFAPPLPVRRNGGHRSGCGRPHCRKKRVQPLSVPDRSGESKNGYQMTEHVRNYYRTAKI
jgi:hypothetical protein